MIITIFPNSAPFKCRKIYFKSGLRKVQNKSFGVPEQNYNCYFRTIQTSLKSIIKKLKNDDILPQMHFCRLSEACDV